MALQPLFAFQSAISGNAAVVGRGVYHTALIHANASVQALSSKKLPSVKTSMTYTHLGHGILHQGLKEIGTKEGKRTFTSLSPSLRGWVHVVSLAGTGVASAAGRTSVRLTRRRLEKCILLSDVIEVWWLQ